jgi:hypothetical protein
MANKPWFTYEPWSDFDTSEQDSRYSQRQVGAYGYRRYNRPTDGRASYGDWSIERLVRRSLVRCGGAARVKPSSRIQANTRFKLRYDRLGGFLTINRDLLPCLTTAVEPSRRSAPKHPPPYFRLGPYGAQAEWRRGLNLGRTTWTILGSWLRDG